MLDISMKPIRVSKKSVTPYAIRKSVQKEQK